MGYKLSNVGASPALSSPAKVSLTSMAGPMSSQPSAIASISNDPLRDPLDSSLPPRPTISSLPSAQVETGTKAPTKTKRCREDGLTKRQRYRARKAQRPQQNVAQTLELGGGTTMVTSGVNDATMQRGEVQGEPKPTRMCLPKGKSPSQHIWS